MLDPVNFKSTDALDFLPETRLPSASSFFGKMKVFKRKNSAQTRASVISARDMGVNLDKFDIFEYLIFVKNFIYFRYKVVRYFDAVC